MTTYPTRIFGDPDANVVYPITDRDGADVNWSTPTVLASKGSATPVSITCTWLGTAGPTRSLRVPLASLPAADTYGLRLVVPGENDISLGKVRLT